MRWLLFPFELIFDLMMEGWFSLMQWIVPEKMFSTGFRIFLRIIIGIFSAVLFLLFIIGILGAIATEATIFDLWKLIFIPLGLGVVQIVLGIIVRCTAKK